MSSRFRFQLQPVLDHRQRILDDRQRELAEKHRDLSDAQAEAARLDADRDVQRDALMRDHGSIDGDTLRTTYAHLAYLDRAIEEQAVRVAACVAETERAQRLLAAANTDRKVLETLKTRRFEAHVADAAQLEQRDSDDQNARRHVRPQPDRGDDS